MIEIEHGCYKVPNTENTYIYIVHSVGADRLLGVVETQYAFVAADGTKPDIGDFISNGLLVKRTEPKVNSDWSRWKDKDLTGPK